MGLAWYDTFQSLYRMLLKDTGNILLVGTSTGQVNNVSIKLGKIASHSDSLDLGSDVQSTISSSSVALVGWDINALMSHDQLGNRNDLSSKRLSIDDLQQTTSEWLDTLHISEDKKSGQGSALYDLTLAPTSLPQHLATIDVETALPRLSHIPTAAKPAFGAVSKPTNSARHNIYALVSAKTRQSWMGVEALFIANADGTVRIVVDKVFDRQFSKVATIDQESQIPLLHCAHHESSYHALVTAQKSTTDGGHLFNLHIKLFQIPFSTSQSPHTPLIVSKTLQLQGLDLYLKQSMEILLSDYKTHISLPTRFMENIGETLTEKGEGTLEQHLYQLAMTGNCSPTITEWLRDELAERVC